MSEFLEILSEGALEELKQVQSIVKTLASDIKSINNFKPSTTPSGADKSSLALAEAYKKREEQMDKARIALQKLSDAEAKAEAQKKAQMAAMFTAQEKANKKIEEQSRAYTELLARQKAATLALRDLVVETGKESAATKKLQKELNALNAELLQAEQSSKKYAMGASSLATPVLLYAEAQKKATQATKEANAERAKANALISKQMTGQMVESVNAIGKPTESLKRMNDYYRELEKTSASEAKSAMANQNLNRAYVQLTNSREQAKNKLQDLIASERASNAEIRKAQKEFDVLNKKVAAADKAVGKFSEANSKINGLSRSVGNLMTAFGVSTGLYLFASIAKDIYQVTKQLQSLDLALKMVSGSQEEFANNQSFLTNLAEQYGIEIKGLTKNFTEFWVASKGKLEAEQIKAIFTSISKSVAVMGLSVEQQDSAFLALQQMMSKGTVQAEELKKQLGNALPGAVKAATMAYQALHPELKVTEKYFMEQMKAGKVLSAELLPELAKAYEKLYGIENVKRAETLQAAQERLQNSWTELVRSMNESKTGGISTFFTSIIDLATRTMTAISRLNSSWDELYAKAGERGKMLGAGAFQERVEEAGFATSTKEEKVKMVLDVARQELIALKEQEKKVNGYLDKAIVKFGSGYRGLQKQKEQLMLDIAARAEIIKLANTELLPKNEKIVPSGAKETEAQRKKRESDERKSEKDRLKAIEDAYKTEYDLKISNLEKQKQLAQEEIDLANAVTQNKEIQYQDVVDATNYYNAILLSIEKAKYDEEVRLAKDNAKEKEIAYNKWFISVMKLTKESNESLLKVTRDFAKEGNDVAKQMLSDFEENAKAFEEIDKRMTQGRIDNDKESLEAQRKTFNEFMGTFADKMGLGESFELFGQLDEDGETYFTKLLDAEDKTKAYFLAISTAAQDAMNVIDQADEERYQRRLERLEKDKETALKYAGDSAAAKEKIEAQYEKKRKALEVKEFKRKQKMAMANIAIDTAQAIMAVIAKSGQPWMSVVVGALGAVQLAMVASQKPPEYWKGTDNAEAGLAFTQERGAEIILDKHKRVKSFGSDGGAQLTMMEKGDKVKTASETKRIMFDAGLNSILSNNGIKEAKIEIVNKGLTVDEMDMVIGKHFANIQTNHTSFDQRGIQQWSEKNGNRTIRNANRGSGIGFRL